MGFAQRNGQHLSFTKIITEKKYAFSIKNISSKTKISCKIIPNYASYTAVKSLKNHYAINAVIV